MIDKKKPFYVLFFASLICFIFGTFVSIIHNSTFVILQKNNILHRNKVLCKVFMLNVNDSDSYGEVVERCLNVKELYDKGINKERDFYKLKVNSNNCPIGFTFSGMGFWDIIEGVIVFSNDLKRILNIQFFKQKETPGLGARIEEEWFIKQFNGLEIDWEAEILNRIKISSSTDFIAKNKIDAIAGATQTSMALCRILNNEIENIKNFIVSENIKTENG